MPTVEVVCLIDPDIAGKAGWQAGAETIRDNLQRNLEKLCAQLGLPASPRLSLDVLERPAPHYSPFIEIQIEQKHCPGSLELFRDVHAFLQGRPPEPWRDFRPGKHWLQDLLSEPATDLEKVSYFLDGLLVEVIQNNAGFLLTPAVTQAILREVQAVDEMVSEVVGEWNRDQLQAIFSRVVREGIALDEFEIIASELYEGLKDQSPPETVAESLIDALAARKIVFHLAPDLLRAISGMGYSYQLPPFATMRDGLFYELGLYYPDFQFALDPSLPPTGFRVQINHLYTVPRIGLSAGEYMVNRDVGFTGSVQIQGRAIVNPGTGADYTCIDSESDAQKARDAGMMAWNAYEYLIIALNSEIRSRSDRIITISRVEKLLENLSHRFPELVKAVRETFSTARLSALFRCMVGEEVSVRNLRLLLEAALEADYVVLDPQNYIVFDDRYTLAEPPAEALMSTEQITEYVRGQIKGYITHKYSGGQNTMYCLLIEPELEKTIGDLQVAGYPPSDVYRRLLAAIADDYRNYVAQYPQVFILTHNTLRGYLRTLIREAFPALPVLSYQELSPDASIQPLARIGMY